MDKNRGGGTIFLYVLMGFLFGLVMVVVATVIAILQAQLTFTLQNIVSVHLTNPLMWVIDSFPLFLAVIVGFLGSREVSLRRMRAEGRDTQKKAVEVSRLNAELAKKDEERQQFEDVISRGKKEWEATFDSVVDMVLLTDEDGKVIRCNRATVYAFHMDFPQVIGTQINELFFGSSASEQMPAQKTELKFPTLDGWHEVSSDPLTFQGVQQGKIFIVRNITDRKQTALDLERQKQFYELMVKNSPVGIITLSLDHRVVACNPAFEKMFGFKQQEVIGQNIDSLISPSELIDESLLMTYNVSQGEVVRKITKRRRKDGELVDVELFGIPVVLWGKQIGILGMYHNVSDLVHAEPMLAGAEVAAIAAALEMAANQEAPVEEEVAEVVEEIEVIEAAPAEEEIEVIEEAQVAAEAPMVAPFIDEEQAEQVESVSGPRRRLIKTETIEGIGPVYSAKLSEFGIYTTEDLLIAGSTRKGRQELIQMTGISDKLILRWVNMADLMRVPGIGEEYSDLLEAAGVDTVKELRNRNPNNLYNALIVANNEKKLVRRAPHLTEVESWVQAAKELDVRMSY